MPGSWNDKEFPHLKDGTFNPITSLPTRSYNCIAYASQDCTQRWDLPEEYYWPDGVEREPTVEAFIKLFELQRYVKCDNGDLEEGIEKVAIYARARIDGSILATHAALQFTDGEWVSKLGDYEDIKHHTLEVLNGDVHPHSYGKPVQFLKREWRPS